MISGSRHVWWDEDASTTKRQLSDLVDAFLASFGVEPNKRLAEPRFFVENQGRRAAVLIESLRRATGLQAYQDGA